LTTKYKKDYRLAGKRGFDLDKLDDVIDKLLAEENLPPEMKDQSLDGSY